MSREGSSPNSEADSLPDNTYNDLCTLGDFTPSPLRYSPIPDTQVLPSPSFYDQHLDPRLQLKKVQLIPSLHLDISQVFLRELEQAKLEELPLPPASEFPGADPERHRDSERTALTIGSEYISNLGLVCQLVAPLFCCLRRTERWPTFYGWNRANFPHSQNCPSFNESYAPTLHLDDEASSAPEIWNSFDEQTLQNLYAVRKHFPKMAVWQMFAFTPQATRIFGEMDQLKALSKFFQESRRPQDFGEVAQHRLEPIQFDSDDAFFKTVFPDGPTSRALSAAAAGVRRSPRIALEESLLNLDSPLSRIITLQQKGSCPPSGADVPASAASVIRHAWARAVDCDATFIVLHCGNFERIGIRHRNSQTLFLSKMIDVTSKEDGPYGALHVGLHICILKDAMNRIPRYVQHDLLHKHGAKNHPVRSLKERWSRANSIKEREEAISFMKVLSNTKHLNAVALHFHYGILSSAAPSVFLRTGVSRPRPARLQPTKYLTVVATGYAGGGATGEVHPARIHCFGSPKRSLSCKAVVKLGFSHLQRKKMRREFEIYEYLSSKHVTGIPHILGLFQDVGTRTLAMIMQDVGESVIDPFHRSPTSRGGWNWTFTDVEKAAFLRVLTSIHMAGVRHRDIRPENLMLTGSGKATIIDFDKALLNASKESRSEELEHLENLLDGDYTAPHEVPSLEQHPAGWREPSGPSSPPEPQKRTQTAIATNANV